MKTKGGAEVWIYVFLNLALNGGELSASRSVRFIEPSYTLDRTLGGSQSRAGETSSGHKNPSPAWNRIPSVQLTASHSAYRAN
jgi:hypothetical protein